MRFSPDSKTLATAGNYDKIVRLWDVDTATEKTTILHDDGRVNSTHFSPDGKTIVTVSSGFNSSVRLWNANTGKLEAQFPKDWNKDLKASFSPDGKTFAVAYREKVLLWDVETGAEKPTPIHSAYVDSVSFSADGKTIVTTSSGFNSNIRLWNVDNGRIKTEIPSVNFSSRYESQPG